MSDVGNRTDLIADPSRQAGEAPADQYGSGERPAVPARRRNIPNMLTERPAEPVQAGLPTGPGARPSGRTGGPSSIERIKAVYRTNPTEEVRQMVEFLQRRGL